MNDSFANAARIVVVDDHGIVRFGYLQLMNQMPTLNVCGWASTEQDGYELIKRERPDLAIIDLSLKVGDGLDLVQSVSKSFPEVKILVISAHDENLFAQRVLAAGALGYINKQEAPEKLIEGIQTVLRGDFFFSAAITRNLLRGRKRNCKPEPEQGIQSLTNRELQVFEQIGKGQSTQAIADAMLLSVKTIERYKENLKQKLHVENATQLVQEATQWILQRGY